jgi:hypothetical protein
VRPSRWHPAIPAQARSLPALKNNRHRHGQPLFPYTCCSFSETLYFLLPPFPPSPRPPLPRMLDGLNCGPRLRQGQTHL